MDFQAPKGRNLLHPFLFLSFIQVLAVNWDEMKRIWKQKCMRDGVDGFLGQSHSTSSNSCIIVPIWSASLPANGAKVRTSSWGDLRLSISRKYKTEVQEVLEQGNLVDN